MTRHDCIETSELQAFLLGSLDEERARTIGRHLEGCPDCEAAAQKLDDVADPLVQSLQRALGSAAPTIDDPNVIPTTGRSPAVPPRTAEFDKYHLQNILGEGGMGTVWLAEQTSPVKRSVAIKLIKERMATGGVLARFEAERQAIARMDHPHIAKLFDAGTTDAGSPYFVMELVQGLPLTQFCDDHRFSIPQRLELFQLVCRAVQHAHQKGIIHRDLKPSNILVEIQDGKPVPKIIDFGLAKAVVGQPLTDRAHLTGYGALLGTPLYMAPEQANIQDGDIDTRADVYALGVILYELLAGSTPIEHSRLNVAMDVILGMIRHEEPPTPSRRLATSDTLPNLASSRRSEPARLARLIQGDLDWIVMKALAKERDQRYATSAAFADDIGRYLRDEPVNAGPPSVSYRLRKFVRRHRTAVTAASLFLLALVGGVIGTTWGFLRAEDQWRRAVHASQQAERASEQAYRALETLTEDVLEGLLSRQAVWGEPERAFLVKIRDQFDQFTAAEGDAPSAQHMRAAARLRLGSIRNLLGDTNAAEADYRAAAAAFDLLAEESARANAAQARRRLGALLATTGRTPEALETLREAGVALDRLAVEFPPGTDYHYQAALVKNDAGYAAFQAGNFEVAEAEERAAAEQLATLATADPKNGRFFQARALALHNLFLVLRRTRREAEAERTIDEVVALYRGADPTGRDPKVRIGLGKALQSRCACLVSRGEIGGAEAALREAIAMHASLGAEYPAIPEYRHELSRCQSNLATIYGHLERAEASHATFRDAVSTCLRLADEFPTVTGYQLQLARTRLSFGLELIASGKVKEGEVELTEALPVWEKLLAAAPGSPACLVGTVQTLGRLGAQADLRKDHAKARILLEKAERLRQASPGLLAREQGGREAELFLILFLARVYANLNDHAACSPRAEELAVIADVDGADNAFNAACYLARCAVIAAKDAQLTPARRATLAEEYAARAVNHLRTAAARGFKQRQLFTTDTDLAPLRDRPDFKELLMTLK